MGSGNSRMESSSSRPRRINQTSCSKLSSLFCGSSSSHAPVEMEESLVNSALHVDTEAHSIDGSSLISGSGTGFTSSITEIGHSSENSSVISVDTSEIRELILPHQVNVGNSQDESYRDRSSSSATTSYQSSDPVSLRLLSNKDVVNGTDDSENEDASHIYSSPQGHRDSHLDEISGENRVVDIDSGAPHASDPSAPSGLGDVLHVDVVSITDTSNRESRRNSRRLFWDAFSRQSSRRLSDAPTLIFSTDETDDIGSHDRWLLDFSGDFFDDSVGSDFGRIRSLNRRRHHSRSEIWERLRDGNGRRTTNCPSGLHADGTCSCESLLMNEESSTHASISRIVMLAEALFEVLDEIHGQPMSLALSMISLPAPESVVDSFPLKNHKKSDTPESGHDVEQCYICLAEYEEGEKIRVLPCKHEYHMSCVDKWLKEIHGVCPLCRRDVTKGGATQCSVSNSNSEVPSI